MQPGQRSGVQPSLRSRLDGVDAPPPPAAPPREPMTEEMPRYPSYPSMEPAADPRRPGPGPGRPDRPGPDDPTRVQPAAFPQHPVAEPDEDFRGGFPERDFEPDGGQYDRADRPDDDVEFDELDPDEELDDELRGASPVREWLIMVGQLALGVLAGGAVWLGFNWLWGALPQAALVLALLVIAGMVLIVRKIRRAEDLQTTVFAVLVGLLATVSPVVLLLVNR
jgi:hypothetical protein